MLVTKNTGNALLSLVLAGLLWFGVSADAHAKCDSSFFNPITDICWHCVFPISIGGVTLIGSSIDTPDDNISNPFCLCGTTFGLSTSFWEPARVIETVKDPYCFNLIGMELGGGGDGFQGGGFKEGETTKSIFMQAHYYMINIWGLFEIFMDLPCLETNYFDIGYITEVDPTWSDDLLAYLINPEALLFGNPVAQMACMADSVAANVSTPIDTLFWCMGSWGSSYPLSGNKTNDDFVQDNAAIASKLIYKLTREYTLWDTGTNVCGPVAWPIWTKSHHRLHVMKPVVDYTCHPIGRSGLIWASMKNPSPSTGADNFDWVMFRKKLCCIGWTF